MRSTIAICTWLRKRPRFHFFPQSHAMFTLDRSVPYRHARFAQPPANGRRFQGGDFAPAGKSSAEVNDGHG